MSKKVAILGGGISGMSAAHELIRRGFQVEVFESLSIPGGKARSVPVPDSGTDGRRPLPGEHGFRFFPAFYRHITATMKEIPVQGGKTAFDSLVNTTRIAMARFDKKPIIILAGFPKNLAELLVILKDLFDTDTGISDDEFEYFAERVWQIITSCSARRLAEYEQIGWWEFIGAATRSEAYQKLLGVGLTRSLVAAQAQHASTRTVGHILVLLLFTLLEPGKSSDRVLNGPTNEVWIDPWRNYLESKGVRYHLDTSVSAIHCVGENITGVSIVRNEKTQQITADYYLMAIPVERMAPLINADMLKADPCLSNIQLLGRDPNLYPENKAEPPLTPVYVDWMNGAQFYLKKDVPLVHGHIIYVDAPWALTSISQKQFWPHINLNGYGDGTIQGILSVDISDWDKPGILYGKSAKDCTLQEIGEEIWTQLKRSLNVEGQELLTDENLHSWFLDPDIQFQPPHDPATTKKINTQPLMVNLVNSWTLRPNAYTHIHNLFLAGDYVKTNTDLATMEGANEAARRAVNSILDASGVPANYCRIWPLNEPYLFKIWRWVDDRRYRKGLPWRKEMPMWTNAIQWTLLAILSIVSWVMKWVRNLLERNQA